MECRFLKDARHCAIERREVARISAVAHAALVDRLHVLTPPPAKVVVLVPAATCTTIACDQAYLVELVGPVQAQCAENIIAGEDFTYNPTQWNEAGSPAYGIPQALPGDKMAAAGPDWATNPRTQLRWLVKIYAGGGPGSAYSSPCSAWATKAATGTY